MGVPDEIVIHGNPKILLDPDSIYTKVHESLDLMDERLIIKKQIKAVS